MHVNYEPGGRRDNMMNHVTKIREKNGGILYKWKRGNNRRNSEMSGFVSQLNRGMYTDLSTKHIQ